MRPKNDYSIYKTEPNYKGWYTYDVHFEGLRSGGGGGKAEWDIIGRRGVGG